MTDLSYSYGDTPPTIITLSFHDCEVMTINNEMSYNSSDRSFTLNGHTVNVVHGQSDSPDTYYIIPAPGYTTATEKAVVPEHESATIDLCLIPMS